MGFLVESSRQWGLAAHRMFKLRWKMSIAALRPLTEAAKCAAC